LTKRVLFIILSSLLFLLVLFGCSAKEPATRIVLEFDNSQDDESVGTEFALQKDILLRNGETSIKLNGIIKVNGTATLQIISNSDNSVIFEEIYETEKTKSEHKVAINIDNLVQGQYTIKLVGDLARSATVILDSKQDLNPTQ